jgi:hypothetical protein
MFFAFASYETATLAAPQANNGGRGQPRPPSFHFVDRACCSSSRRHCLRGIAVSFFLQRFAFFTVVCMVAIVGTNRTHAATWRFDRFAQGLNNLTGKTLQPIDSLQPTIAVGHPANAVFYEGGDGLSINSTGIAQITDQDGAAKINMVTVNGLPKAAAESIAFSFNKSGVLTGIDFDGVKDESLEYFVLTSTSGTRINFFDSFANASIPGAVSNAAGMGIVTGEIVYLMENAQFDDEAQGLRIPFTAGQQFVIAYAELPPVAHIEYQAGDGSRLQGISAELVPEPSMLASLVSLASIMLRCNVRRRKTNKTLVN